MGYYARSTEEKACANNTYLNMSNAILMVASIIHTTNTGSDGSIMRMGRGVRYGRVTYLIMVT